MNRTVNVVLLTDDSAFKNYENRNASKTGALRFAESLKRHRPFDEYFVVEKIPGTYIVCRQFDPNKEDMNIPFVKTAVLDLERMIFI